MKFILMKFILLSFTLFLMIAACSSEHTHDSDTYTDAMAHEHHNDIPVPSVAASYEPNQPVTSRMVAYGEAGELLLRGFLAEPEDAEAGAAIPSAILIHEWWGLNENIQTMARRLAGEGYRVLAVDFYFGEVAENPQEAQGLMRSAMANFDAGISNLSQAAGFLADAGSSSVGVMGWCFGGAWTLNAAIAISDQLDAGVIYYGRVNTNPEELARIDIPLLGIFGEADGGIPVEGVREFEALLGELGKQAEIHIYADADHAFANPSGTRYLPEAAADAWEKTLEFLARNLN
ncbi:MAG: dienelactone hydrolase family protein [Candidatus Cyclonatronum sp.]|uniref:dienelactone hydrolase family protein n=1 Tax=Cyclonatronum sp. TaxID=3024185 RepID=UPI0025B8E44D|nr:dienelactone hydrolase family protein [Cyclonatronum sp.]MCC5934583.1 dienelactone hydrolase family protein [Balneolales bacterium]MCH8487386.1 dienelactone hydrolase family protein [Cyclonatronum sp.]